MQAGGDEHACMTRSVSGGMNLTFFLNGDYPSETERKKLKERERDQRQESEVRRERKGESEQWYRTKEHWSSDGCCPLTIRAFEGEGGASCWQCQGPYQPVSASATETND